MCVRRDDSTHLPRRRSNDHSVHGNELPTATTTLDDMIDALDHDISRIAVDRASTDTISSHSRDTYSQLSFQLLD